MDTIQTIMERRSIRKYQGEPIPAERMKTILEAARQAPTAANRQPLHFVVVGDAEQKRRVAEACNNQMWMAEAAYILVAIGLPAVSSKWFKVDVAISLQNLVLAAYSLGYGTCWIGAFDPERVRLACDIPADMEVVACTPLGVPDASPAARPRKEWDQLFSANRYGQPLKL
jgi:nitroreductase